MDIITTIECCVTNEAPFYLWDSLNNHTKVYELRLAQPNTKWATLLGEKPATGLNVLNPQTGHILNMKITSIRVFDTFSGALQTLGYLNCIPTATDFEKARSVYTKYFPKGEQGNKVVAIGLAV
jgi:ASC-1-like (ASCH) protein